MANLAYVRVSTDEQNETRQIDALKRYDIDRWFIEKQSGKDVDREQLQELLAYAQAGDKIYTLDLSRLSRSLSDFLQMLESLKARGILLVSLSEGLDLSTPIGELVATIMMKIYEFERIRILSGQRGGIVAAKAEGKYKGRRATPRPARWAEYMELLRERKITKRELARMLKISRPTLDRLIEAEGESYE
jgi:DNA invertase Pin-like site-specific DNA recombinase